MTAINKQRIAVLGIWVILAAAVFGALGKERPQREKTEKVLREFWVSPTGRDTNSGTAKRPFASVQQARKAVRGITARGGKGVVRVWLDEGVYTLDEPLTFGPEDGGTEELKVVYQAQANKEVILSGGRTINGWQKGEDNIWSVQLDDVKNGKWYFRDLYAGAERLTRSRWPNEGDPYLLLKEVLPPNKYLTEQQFVMDRDLPMGNLAQQDAEVIFLIVWSSTRKLVRSTDGATVTTEFPAGYRGHALCQPSVGHHTRVYLENAPAFIDVPGEWYLDRDSGVLKLKLAEGQTPDTMKIAAPVIHQLLAVKGQKDVLSQSALSRVSNSGMPTGSFRWPGITRCRRVSMGCGTLTMPPICCPRRCISNTPRTVHLSLPKSPAPEPTG
jgi:hypothetical protein